MTTTITSEEALELWGAGYTVIPVGEDKAPRAAYKQLITEDQSGESVAELFASPAHGIGILAKDGIEVIDIDVKNYEGKLNLLHELFDIAGYAWEDIGAPWNISLFPIVQTRSGGWHIYFRSDHAQGNQKFAYNKEKKAIIESRGLGGYVVAPPTPGYEWHSLLYNIDGIPLLSNEERDVLLTACRSFNEYIEAPVEIKTPAPINILNTGKKPGEDYNDKAGEYEVTKLLVSHGWKVCKSNAERVYYTRPGKEKGISGDFNKNLNLFKCWSSSVGNLPTEEAINPFALFAHLEFRGDYSAAAKALAQSGYGDKIIAQHSPMTAVGAISDKIVKTTRAKWYVPGEETPTQRFTINQISASGYPLPILGPGMICGVAGPQKSRKSLFLHALIAGALSGNPYLGIKVELEGKTLLHVDCEQPEYWWRRDISRIEKMNNGPSPLFKACNMRKMTPLERQEEFYEQCITLMPGIIVLDGLVDLCLNFNDIPASQSVMDLIMRITAETNAVLITVLHTTKSDGFVRGHLGSFLQQKADYVIQVSPMEENIYSQAKALDARGKPMAPINFVQGDNDLPVLYNFMKSKGTNDWA